MKALQNILKSILTLVFVTLLLTNCSRRVKLSNPASYKEVINLYTSNNQSVKSPIVVQFVEDAVKKKGKNKVSNVFEISPSVKGELVWDKKNRLKFVPQEKLESGKEYVVKVALDKLYKNIPDSLKEFTFSFKTKEQNFEFGHTYLSPIKDSMYLIAGSVITEDILELKDMMKVMTATLDGKPIKIDWNKHPVNHVYRFKLDSLKRGLDPRKLLFQLDGSPLDLSIKKEKELTLHALGDFKLSKVEVLQDQNQELVLSFSNFIKASQVMDGLIYTDKGEFEMTVDENKIRLTFKEQISGKLKVFVERGLMSDKGYRMQEKTIKEVVFEPLVPGVRLENSKTILPSGKTMPFIFETVNLKAVDVRITKIYQNNLLQFLQRNNLDGSYGLRYVGDVVYENKIELSTNRNLSMWNKQVIDLKSLIEKEPGALYHVQVGFRRSYSTYPCDALENENYDPSTLGIEDKVELTEENFWLQKDQSINNNWNERENPCNPVFYLSDYRENRTISTNVLGSDLGMITKEEKNGDLLVAVTSINTAKPLNSVKVEVFNLQNRKLKTAYTNAEGTVNLKDVKKPFLVIASKGKERGYLKLRHAESISLSRFDVDGNADYKDIKGFLYAERGVWRPGDSIYINLILDNKFNNLPEDYPIGFEFRNPNGQIVERRTMTKGLNGHYAFWTKTDVNDVTGDYYVKAYVGDAVLTKSIKVETIRPNRLKMDFVLGNKDGLLANTNVPVEFNTKWLHGAPGNGLRHKVDVTYSSGYTYFKGYRGYDFVAPYRSFENSYKVFLDETSNEDGQIRDSVFVEKFDGAPGFVNAYFDIKVFEDGGRFSIDQYSTTYYPYQNYVGIKGKPYSHKIEDPVQHEIVNLSKDGKLVEDKLIVSLYELSYNWWYDLNDKDEYKYKGEINKSPIKLDTLLAVNGKLKHRLLLGDGYKNGRYLLTVENSSGHKTGEVLYFYDNRYDYVEQTTEGTKNLSLTVNKKKYKEGETVRLTIPTASQGKVFVSLEDGRKILKTAWVNVTGKSTEYSFKATSAMSPYVYANVMYIQPHLSKKNDLPLRMYGAIPIQIESENSHLNPVILMKDELKPKKPFQIKIKEQNQLPMTYTIAIVDEGLLDITHYKTPKIWKEFNKKPALEIKTWDIFDRVIEAEKFDVRNLLSLGGDGGEEAPEGVKLNRFKPMVKFIGPFYCKPGETKLHDFEMPNYVGSVRVMVIAGHNQAYGSAEKTVEVKNPLMVLGTMPRVLGPKESVQLPVDIFAMKEWVKDVSIEIEANDLLEVVKGKKASLKFDRIGDKQVFFNLKTKEKFGIAKIKITATSGKEKATYEVALEVRPSNTYQAVVQNEVLPKGTTFTQKYKSFGYDGTNSITVEVSSIPPINLKKRLDYLIHYPYGCVEQTTSSVFPQLYLSTLMDLDQKRKHEIESNVQSGINRLKRFQTQDGGFSYWPGGYNSNDWGSNYAGHFLIEAKEKGFDVSEDMMERWVEYQVKLAKKWDGSGHEKLVQAYRLYLLSKMGKPNKGAMNRLRLMLEAKELAGTYLAAAYGIIGKESIAEKILENMPTPSENDNHFNYGSYHRDNAIILLTYSELNASEKTFKLAKSIAQALNKDQYMSTQTTAYCLLAMSHFVEQNGGNSGLQFNLDFEKEKVVKTNKSLWQKTLYRNGNMPVTIENTSNSPLFVTITQNGIPKIDKDTLVEDFGLNMSVVYMDRNEHVINPDSLKQGEDFMAEVTVTNWSNRYQNHVSLTQIFPSGWEIQNSRLSGNPNMRNQVNYEDIRDDRVNMFFTINHKQTKTFRVFLNASYQGSFYLPAVQIEAMYNHDIRARRPGRWVVVLE